MLYRFLLVLFFITIHLTSYSQIKNSYFDVNSAHNQELSIPERLLVEKALKFYHHPESSLLIKLKAISLLTDELNHNVWQIYNNWLIDTCEHLIASNQLSKVEKYGVSKLLATSYNNLGFLYNTRGELDSALYIFNISFKKNKEINNLYGVAQAYNNIGYIYGEKGLTDVEIIYYSKSLTIREQLDDKKGIANSLNNIGFLYKNNKNYDEALKYYVKSLPISIEIKDLNSVSVTLNNISFIYLQLENYKRARLLLSESLSIRENQYDEFGIAQCYESIGFILEKQNVLDSAEHYYNLSLKLREKINDKKGICTTLYRLGYLYYYQSNIIKSIEMLNESLKKSMAIKNTPLILKNTKLLGDVYKKQEDYKRSLNMLSLYSSLNDSVKDYSISKELEKQKNSYELKKNETIDNLNLFHKNILLNKSKRDLSILVVILFIFISIFIFLLAFLRRKVFIINLQKKKLVENKELLLKLNEKQSTLLLTQDTLLKEIHHRVKNNLQVITSLLSLQSSFIEDEKTKRVFQYSQYRINSMAMVHEMLYQLEDLSKIKIYEYIQNLSSNLIKSMKGSNHNIQLNLEIPELFLNIDTVIPLGLLINEILTNSLKYGLRNNNGILYIKIIHFDKENFIMYIGDNGNGFKDEEKFRAANSLGLILIHNLTLQLKGTIEKDNDTKGTNYIITFKENLTSFKNYEKNIDSGR